MALSEFNTNSVMRSPHQWRYLGAVSLYLGDTKRNVLRALRYDTIALLVIWRLLKTNYNKQFSLEF